MAAKNAVGKVWGLQRSFDGSLDSRYQLGDKPGGGAPTILGATFVGKKEKEDSTVLTTALSLSTAGVSLVSMAAVRTALFTGPTPLNNGNSFGSAIVNEIYSPNFNQYSLRVWALLNALGGSNHSGTLTKSPLNDEEASAFLIALSACSSITATAVVRNAAGNNTAHTSAAFDVTGTPARCIAIASGTGFSDNGTVQSISMLSAGWTPVRGLFNGASDTDFGYWFSNVTASFGHIPIGAWERTLSPGTGNTWQAQPNNNGTGFDEGLLMATIVAQQ